MFIFLSLLAVFFVCIVIAMVGYTLFSLVEKEGVAHKFYVLGMVLMCILLVGIAIRVFFLYIR